MYFDFGDGHPDTPRLPGALSTREEFLVTVIVHLLIVIAVLVVPRTEWARSRAKAAESARLALLERPRENQPKPFMFVQPQVDLRALRPPPQAPPSDMDREARTRERAPNPKNSLPFSRGNTPEYIERTPPAAQSQARAPGPETPPLPPAPEQGSGEGERNPTPVPEVPASPNAYLREARAARPPPTGAAGQALRSLVQRYAERAAFDNPQGGNGQFGPSIQFDTKGVDFGPWVRRFRAQIMRNWFVPYAAMSLRGHTVLTFNVDKDGTISDLMIVAPSDVDAFNHAAYNALASSNPTHPLPPEYPSDRAFFTVTFYYNETPPAP